MPRTKHLSAALLILAACSREVPQICVPVLPGWSSEQTGKPAGALLANVVTLDGSNILWNGQPISEQTLTRYAGQMAGMNPIPFMILDPGKASDCTFARHIRDVLDKELPCREGACWQGSKAAYERAPFKKQTGTGVP